MNVLYLLNDLFNLARRIFLQRRATLLWWIVFSSWTWMKTIPLMTTTKTSRAVSPCLTWTSSVRLPASLLERCFAHERSSLSEAGSRPVITRFYFLVLVLFLGQRKLSVWRWEEYILIRGNHRQIPYGSGVGVCKARYPKLRLTFRMVGRFLKRKIVSVDLCIIRWWFRSRESLDEDTEHSRGKNWCFWQTWCHFSDDASISLPRLPCDS